MRLVVFLLLMAARNFAFSQKTAVFDPYVTTTSNAFHNVPFKALTLEDTGGHLFNTAALRGKTLYVDFWFTSCPPCIKEIPYAQSLHHFFVNDTNLVFLSICIDNIDRKPAWKQMILEKQMHGIHLFYARNRPQTINLLREYDLTFPTYLLVNKEMRIIGYRAPRPSEEGWVHWAIVQAEQNIDLFKAYDDQVNQSKEYKLFLESNWPTIVSLRK